MANYDKYVSGSKASAILGVHQRTLYLWDEKKLIEVIRTPGGKRLYNVQKYLADIESNKKACGSNSPSIAPPRIYNITKKTKSLDLDQETQSPLGENKHSILNGKNNFSNTQPDSIPIMENNIVSDKKNIIFTKISSSALTEKYPDYLLISGEKALTIFLDLIIDNKANNIVIDKSCWNVDSYNILVYLIKKFSDGTIIEENQLDIVSDSEKLNHFMSMMNNLIKNQ